MLMSKIRCCAVLASLGLSTSLFAENAYKPGEYYFSPGVAYYHFSEKRDLQNAAMIDLTAGVVVSEQFSLEAFYGQVTTQNPSLASDEDARFYTYWMDGVYHFQTTGETNFHPYAMAGLGLSNQEDSTTTNGNTTLVGVNAGVGIEYFVNPNISLFTDVRDIYTLSGGQNDWMLNAGIKFLFGGSNANDSQETPQAIDTSGVSGFYQLQESSSNEG